MSRRLALIVLGAVLAIASLPAAAATAQTADPSQFDKVALATDIGEPMELTVLPDGRVLYLNRVGRVNLWSPETGRVTTAAEIPVYTGQEDGLLGITTAPDFAESNQLYVYYAPADDESRNRLARFTMAGDEIDLESEEVILEVGTQREECCHAGGALAFGPDGELYLATGDNSNPFESDGYTPIDERPDRGPFDAQKSAANTNDLRGKILRIVPLAEENADGLLYDVPDTNLFAGDDSELTRPEIYVMGARNPFRLGVDQETGDLFWADYGPDAGSADPERGPAATVEFNLTPMDTPGNHGWPYCVGDNEPFIDYDFATQESGEAFDCDNPVNDSPNNTGLTEGIPPSVPATIPYPNTGEPPFPAIGAEGGGAPMGGESYSFDPDLESENKFPEEFDGLFFGYEWGRDWINTFAFDDAGAPTAVEEFLPETVFNAPMDMEFGPDGALYVLEYGGCGFFQDCPEAGLFRIDYSETGATTPRAIATADPTSGAAPLEVTFDAADTFDPKPGPLELEWDFGDGSDPVMATTSTPVAHTYTENGTYSAQLTVTDDEDRVGRTAIEIVVGNTPPEVLVEAPLDGSFFEYGDEVPFRIDVTDAEDSDVDCAGVRVDYALGHDTHAHPLQDTTGCEGSIVTPAAGGHGADANVFGLVSARYTDQGAEGADPLQGTGGSLLQPKLKQAEFNTGVAEGVGPVDGEPGVIEGLGDDRWVAFDPVSLIGVDAITFTTTAGGADGELSVVLGAPEADSPEGGTTVGAVPVAEAGTATLEVPDDVDTASGTMFVVGTGADDVTLDFFEVEGAGATTPVDPGDGNPPPGGGGEPGSPPGTGTPRPGGPDDGDGDDDGPPPSGRPGAPRPDGGDNTPDEPLTPEEEPVEPGLLRYAGDGRVETAVDLSRANFAPGVAAVVIATGNDFADAVSAGPVAAELGGPVLLAGQDLPEATAEELARLQPEQIVVVGGPVAIAEEVEQQLGDLTAGPVVRYGGLNRWDTSAVASAAVFAPGVPATLATGAAFPDSLTGGAAAGVVGGPVLLVGTDEVPATVAAELTRLDAPSTRIVGGTTAVSTGVEEQIVATGTEVVRWGGENRFETAAQVAAGAFPDGAETAFVATGADFADALAAVPVAALSDSPILLVTVDDVPDATDAELQRLRPARIVVLGGTAAIGDAVVAELDALRGD